ncbi:uncharacterized protein LOC131860122 [Cryptomeria japonica]|uniref:uncharacterized protein LOC131860122 n=1 Tax=Cryptomeria japonica TaxID=3369 RepID=UPI0027DA0BE1|nr:uncharacterized protein LOC131860122 [Cryptomeria japonica]
MLDAQDMTTKRTPPQKGKRVVVQWRGQVVVAHGRCSGGTPTTLWRRSGEELRSGGVAEEVAGHREKHNGGYIGVSGKGQEVAAGAGAPMGGGMASGGRQGGAGGSRRAGSAGAGLSGVVGPSFGEKLPSDAQE